VGLIHTARLPSRSKSEYQYNPLDGGKQSAEETASKFEIAHNFISYFALNRRCFKALGFDEYMESHGDGLQILRYNLTKAYSTHMDWIAPTKGAHDFNSAGIGGNRFATILLYMSDLDSEDGGETVFPQGWPPGLPEEERLDSKTVSCVV
jgi:hypothetical protein